MVAKKIFLASSSELREDRREFEIFINRKNKEWASKGVFLQLELWEDFLDALSGTRLQDEYNKAIRDCDIFVMLFWTKVGQYTEEEFETAFGQFQATHRPFIFTYFKDAEISTGSAHKKDLMSLWAFQEKLAALGHFYTVYKNVDELKYKFNQQLEKLAANGFIQFDQAVRDAAQSANQAQLTGSGAIAQGAGAVAVGRGGVFVGGANAGNINTGTQFGGDMVRGDKVLGDRIGSQINTGGGAYFGGNVKVGGNLAGRDMHITQGMSAAEIEPLFAPLLAIVSQHAEPGRQEAALQQVRELQLEVEKGDKANDGRVARIVDGLTGMVPQAVASVLGLFASPILEKIAGPVTKFVLDKLKLG